MIITPIAMPDMKGLAQRFRPTSNNGAGMPGVKKDNASGPFRGSKGSGWEGGNRELSDSQSFLPVLKGKSKKTARLIMFSVKHKQAPFDEHSNGNFNISIARADQMKLIAYFNPRNDQYEAVELYNLDRDVSEKKQLGQGSGLYCRDR